jgi:hypothetical protein
MSIITDKNHLKILKAICVLENKQFCEDFTLEKVNNYYVLYFNDSPLFWEGDYVKSSTKLNCLIENYKKALNFSQLRIEKAQNMINPVDVFL